MTDGNEWNYIDCGVRGRVDRVHRHTAVRLVRDLSRRAGDDYRRGARTFRRTGEDRL